MAFRKTKPVTTLPLVGWAIAVIEVRGSITCWFTDPGASRLIIEGTCILSAQGQTQEYLPPYAPWVQDVVDSFVQVPISLARYDRSSRLQLCFIDERTWDIPDGPFENWHYTNRAQHWLHGGIGRVG